MPDSPITPALTMRTPRTGLDIARNRVMIEIACNDPDNGSFAGRAEEIHIGAQLIELEPRCYGGAPRLVELPGDVIRLAGKKWQTHGCKEWLGNWCWNGYWFDIPVAVDFLTWLHARRLFCCTTGETRIFNMWKNSAAFDADDRAFLDRMLGKPSNFNPW